VLVLPAALPPFVVAAAFVVAADGSAVAVRVVA